EACTERYQDFVDEGGFAVEDVDFAAGHFAVDEERQSDFTHRFEHCIHTRDVLHAACGIGGGTGRVQLHTFHNATGRGLADFIGRGGFGQVQRHQRFKAAV